MIDELEEIDSKNQIYIISDVHGCYKTLKALVKQLPNKESSKIVFVGDLIDRGSNSYDVVEFVLDNNYDCVKGNHEEMFLDYAPIDDSIKEISSHWLYSCGGEETCNSYLNNENLNRHYKYFENLPLYLEYKDYRTKDNRYLVISHSSVGKVWDYRYSLNRVDMENFKSEILWGRKNIYDNSEIFNVYGHTIYPEPKKTAFSMGIDLGCCYTHNKWKISNPRLCALEFPSMRVYTQNNIDQDLL